MKGYIVLVGSDHQGLDADQPVPIQVFADRESAVKYGETDLRFWGDYRETIEIDLASDPRIAQLVSAANAAVVARGHKLQNDALKVALAPFSGPSAPAVRRKVVLGPVNAPEKPQERPCGDCGGRGSFPTPSMFPELTPPHESPCETCQGFGRVRT